MKQKPIRGTYAFSALSQACVILERRGLWAAIRFIVARSMVGVFNFIWKARRVWHWAWSPLVSDDEYTAKDAVCLACKHQKVTDKGRFCQQCGCADWRWSELTVKNTREGHVCPRGLHPGQTPMPALRHKGGCKGCGPKSTNGKNADAAGSEMSATLERTELASTDRR